MEYRPGSWNLSYACRWRGGYDQDFTDWALYWSKQHLTVRLNRPGEGSKNFSVQPYRIVWDMKSIYPELPELLKREAVHVLKEALTCYGNDGIRHQVPNTIVEFKF